MNRSKKDEMIHWYSDLLTVNKPVPRAALDICEIWRKRLNAAGVRLWLFNKDFDEFDLLAHSCEDKFDQAFQELTNQLPLSSIEGKAFTNREVMRINTATEHPSSKSDPAGEKLFNNLPALLCIPLVSLERTGQNGGDDTMLGVLDIHFLQPDQTEFQDEDFHFLGSLSASALARGHSFDRKEVFEELNKIALDLVVPAHDKLFAERKTAYFSQLMNIIRAAVYANCASIFTADPGFDTIRCCASTGIERIEKDRLHEVAYRKGEGATWAVFEGNKPLNSKNVRNVSDYRGRFKETRTINAKSDSDPFLAVPMRGQQGKIATGVIRVLERRCHVGKQRMQNFSQYDVDMLMNIAGQVSPVFRLLSLHEHRQHYVARMAHQVIQPITGIVTYSSNLLEGIYKDPQEILQKLQYIRAMSRSAARLTLGSEWVALARDFGFLKKIQKTERNVRQYILERILDMKPIRENAGIEIKLVNEEQVAQLELFWCDELYFDQVVQNVLHNAVKYSYPGTEITVCIKADGQSLIMDVTSIGIPIEKTERERIFSDMERGKWANYLDPNGTGQGLCICRQIMSGFGGKIELIDSKPSMMNVHKPKPGLPVAYTTTFQITLPEALR